MPEKDLPWVPIPILPYYLVCSWSHFAVCFFLCAVEDTSPFCGLSQWVALQVCYSGKSPVVCPNCMHTVCNSHFFVRVAAVRTTSTKKNICDLERSHVFWEKINLPLLSCDRAQQGVLVIKLHISRDSVSRTSAQPDQHTNSKHSLD